MHGAVICNSRTKLRITNSIFKSNIASYSRIGSGGAISSVFSNYCVISNCSFIENQGGTVVMFGTRLKIETSKFENNIDKYREGGAVYSNGSTHVLISGSSFLGNKAHGNGAALYSYAAEKIVQIISSLFKNNIVFSGERSGGAISSFKSTKVYIFNSSFIANEAKGFGSAISSIDDYMIIYSYKFNWNRATCGGAIICRLSWQGFDIEISSFIGNSATICGGAILLRGHLLFISSSTFSNNTALHPEGTGGALQLELNTFAKKSLDPLRDIIEIFHCNFSDNLASFRGGTIMGDGWTVSVYNSSFQSSSYFHNDGFFGGEFIYSTCLLFLEYVLLEDKDVFSARNSLILHAIKRDCTYCHVLLKKEVHINCLNGKKIQNTNQTTFNHPNIFSFLEVSCSFCPQNSYSLSAGRIALLPHNNLIKKTTVKCNYCPSGGVCNKGKIQAINNFWGYITDEKFKFYTCPFGYCCFGNERKTYSSCHERRTGPLCGNCESGFTENLLNAECLAPVSCRNSWFWLLGAMVGIAYLIVFMYLDEITNAVEVLLIPNFVLRYFRRSAKGQIKIVLSKLHRQILLIKQKCSPFHQIQYITDDICMESLENEENFNEIQSTTELLSDSEMHEERQGDVSLNEESGVNIFPGLLKIITFFYQSNVLLKIYSGSKS